MKLTGVVLMVITLSGIVGFKTPENQNNNLIVLVKYTTLPGKQAEAVAQLKNLIEKVRAEKHFVEIRMHIDQNDDTRILLYEEWESEEYYKNEHMQTEHLKKFITDSRNFLAGPPDISFWGIHSEYK